MKAFNVAACALAALLAACGRRDEHAVAKVDGSVITQTEAAAELRNLLWRRGETWNALAAADQSARQRLALENLINDRLIAEFTAKKPNNPNFLRKEREDEFQQFLRQFPPPDEWRERMELQGLDESRLRGIIGAEVKQTDAVEQWIAGQPDRVTGADARAWFDAHPKEMVVPERVRASHIFLTRHDKEKPDRKLEIRELHRKLTAGEATFEELAAKYSDDESAKLHGGDLGSFTPGRVPPEFAEKAFSLPVGEASAPFESHLGWHILLVKEHLAQRAATFEEMSGEISALLETRWRETSVRRLVEELRADARIEKFPDRLATISPP